MQFDLERFRSGDRAYVEAVIIAIEPMVWSICSSFAVGPDHAEDLAQETWKRVYTRINDVRNAGGLRAWVRRVSITVCLDDKRDRERRSTLHATYATDEAATKRSTALDPLTRSERGERSRALWRAIGDLPAAQRTVLSLRVLEGYMTGEVADLMEIPPATVRSHLRHAIERLRQFSQTPAHELSRYRSTD